MRAFLLILGLVVAACGDDTAASDAGVDAAIDGAATLDAPPPGACETLCDCMTQYCSDDVDECMARCNVAPPTTQTCWIQHCGYAQTNPVTHCPHARGEDLPGTDPACVFPPDGPADAGTGDAGISDAGIDASAGD